MDAREHNEAGYLIAGEFFPQPERFRIGDPVLVRELTGMEFTDWAKALDDEEAAKDPVLQIGLLGVAVWQRRPNWTRLRVRQYVESLDSGLVEYQPGAPQDPMPGEEPEGAGSPPAEGEAPAAASQTLLGT